MKEAPALNIIDPEDANTKFELHTDVSGFALGAVLYQKFGKEIKPESFHSVSLILQRKIIQRRIKKC